MRFPEFSGEWTKCKLGEIAEFCNNRISSKCLTNENYISTENLLQDFAGVSIAANVPNNATVISFNCGDVLFSNIRPYLKKVWQADKNGGCSADVLVLRSNNNNFIQTFLYYIVANDKFISYVMSGAKGVKMPRGDKEHLIKYALSIPSLEEQHKISKFISLIDDRISTQNKIIDKLESLIKGIYNSILWQPHNKVTLSEILSEKSERTVTINQYQVISSTAKGLFLQSEYFDKEVASADNTGYKILRRGQIVLSPQNLWLGNINYNDKYDIGIVSPSYKIFSISQDFNPLYIAAIMKTQRALFEYACASEQGASVVRRNLNMEEFLAIAFPMPSLEVQNSLATKFSAIQQKLDIEKQILDKLKEQKKYLLSQMFI